VFNRVTQTQLFWGDKKGKQKRKAAINSHTYLCWNFVRILPSFFFGRRQERCLEQLRRSVPPLLSCIQYISLSRTSSLGFRALAVLRTQLPQPAPRAPPGTGSFPYFLLFCFDLVFPRKQGLWFKEFRFCSMLVSMLLCYKELFGHSRICTV
jgi:hypothetical protein